MKRLSWMLVTAGVAALCTVAGAGALRAQSATGKSPRQVLSRRPAFQMQAPLSPQVLAKKAQALKARALVGTYLLFQYDSGLTRELDLDNNGQFQDNGDRVLFQGTVWVSNRNGAKVANAGRFSSIYDYLDISGESTGTDLTQTTDILMYNTGQIRAGGFWNVVDGIGDPTLPVTGATGKKSLRRYKNGQLIFIGTVADGEELYFLAR